jgi:uncharacterized cupin superfamily protein
MTDTSPTVLRAADVTARTGTAYPPQYAGKLKGREKRLLGELFGLSQFGVNLLTLAPGSWSSQRHWHEAEDEFVYVLEGEIVLIDDRGEHPMSAGMCAGFKAGVANAHHLVNRSDKPAVCLEVGTRMKDERVYYADIDMQGVRSDGGPWKFTRRDGSPP